MTLRLLLGIAVSSLVIATVVLMNGGFTIRTPLFDVRAHRPIVALAIASLSIGAAVRMAGRDRVRRDLAAAWSRVDKWAAGIALLVAIAAGIFGIAAGTFSAGGADSYGYVSQAGLWKRGSLHIEQPLAASAPWPDPEWTFSPLGYRPATVPATIVPTYPPGLPLTMALFSAVAGEPAVFYVVPVLGGLAVWLTYAIGRMVINPVIGLTASVLFASSPIFLFQLVQPMSDVPVTAWWLASIAVALLASPRASFASGLAASLAVLTRPNLAPLGCFVALLTAVASGSSDALGERLKRVACFIAGAVPGVVAVALIQNSLYGSPLESGYGRTQGLFGLENVWPNLQRYPRWMWETQTPLIVLAFLGPFLVRRVILFTADPSDPAADTVRTRRAWLLLAFFIATLCAYLPYFPFEDWNYLRFLLPALPLLLILFSIAMVAGIQLLPRWLHLCVWLTITAGFVAYYVEIAEDRQALALRSYESRYVDIGRYVARTLPANAIVLASQHSGSLRYYATRTTIRWDWLDPQWLDRALEFLRQKGFTPFIVLEDWEEPQFRKRFGQTSSLGGLDWPPRAQIRRGPYVRLYAFGDRARFIAGERLEPDRLPDETGSGP